MSDYVIFRNRDGEFDYRPAGNALPRRRMMKRQIAFAGGWTAGPHCYGVAADGSATVQGHGPRDTSGNHPINVSALPAECEFALTFLPYEARGSQCLVSAPVGDGLYAVYSTVPGRWVLGVPEKVRAAGRVQCTFSQLGSPRPSSHLVVVTFIADDPALNIFVERAGELVCPGGPY